MANPTSGQLTTSARTGSIANVASSARLILGGTFGAGSPVVSVEVLGADGTWYPSADTYSTGDVDAIAPGAPSKVRVVLAGGDGTTDIYYEITH